MQMEEHGVWGVVKKAIEQREGRNRHSSGAEIGICLLDLRSLWCPEGFKQGKVNMHEREVWLFVKDLRRWATICGAFWPEKL